MTRYSIAPKIDANSVWRKNDKECAKLYKQFVGYFKGSVKAMLSYYGWKRQPLIDALRYGRNKTELKT